MNFLTKIEDLINRLIIRFCELVIKSIKRMTPKKVIELYSRIQLLITYISHNFKSLPRILKTFLAENFLKTKSKLLTINYKEKAAASAQKVQGYYKAQSAKGAGRINSLFVAPAAVISQWLQGLSAGQSVLLMVFTASSILAGIKVISSGNRILDQHDASSRSPASAEEEIKYDRPNYYKKELRHVLVTNIRLPIYIGKVNELKSVDIDFNVTTSNRQSKKFLEKYEFQLRDYLILHIEPMIASFPLEDEGKEILTKKIWLEIDNFLKERNVQAHVIEVKITYVLAN